MKDLKNTLSNIFGVVLLVSGSVLTVASAGVLLPAAIVTYATVGATVSVSLIAYLTGKLPNGQKKTPEQVEAQINPVTQNQVETP